jgi:hypothetical protein
LPILLSILALAASAAGVAGKWKGTAETGAEIVLVLQAEGAQLTGTASLNGVEKPTDIPGGIRAQWHQGYSLQAATRLSNPSHMPAALAAPQGAK